jgi:hypothetical protein
MPCVERFAEPLRGPLVSPAGGLAVTGSRRCRMHGGTNPGPGRGNINALQHGRRTAEAEVEARSATGVRRAAKVAVDLVRRSLPPPAKRKRGRPLKRLLPAIGGELLKEVVEISRAGRSTAELFAASREEKLARKRAERAKAHTDAPKTTE